MCVWGALQQEGLESELGRSCFSFMLCHRVTQLVVSKPPAILPSEHSATQASCVISGSLSAPICKMDPII